MRACASGVGFWLLMIGGWSVEEVERVLWKGGRWVWWRRGRRAGECGVAVKSQMRGNCFESEQIWRSEIRADDGGSGGVIRIRACVGGGVGLCRE